jgi:MFS family permease
MVCDPQESIDLIGSMMFIGFALGSILFVPLADVYGRKIVLLVVLPINFVGAYLLISPQSVDMLYFACFIFSMCFLVRACVTFLLLCEQTVSKEKI